MASRSSSAPSEEFAHAEAGGGSVELTDDDIPF
jgi:hypothetical protein